MHLIQTLWERVQGDPVFMRMVNGWLTIFWIVMIPIAYVFGWLESVTFVSALSLWALVSGHWSAWQAARTEVQQQKEAQKDTEGKIAQRVIRESNLHKSTKNNTTSRSKKTPK